jgi:hypothetical protein
VSDQHYLDLITEARARNNLNWMEILRVALKHSPDETRSLLKQIKALDLDISYYTSRIANADSGKKDRD